MPKTSLLFSWRQPWLWPSIFLLFLVFLSCQRQQETVNPKLVQLNTDPVQIAQNWYDSLRSAYPSRTKNSGSATARKQSSLDSLPYHPVWEEAEHHTLKNGSSLIITPVWRYQNIVYFQHIGFLRRLVIQIDSQGKILESNIIELVGTKSYLREHAQEALQQFYEHGTVKENITLIKWTVFGIDALLKNYLHNNKKESVQKATQSGVPCSQDLIIKIGVSQGENSTPNSFAGLNFGNVPCVVSVLVIGAIGGGTSTADQGRPVGGIPPETIYAMVPSMDELCVDGICPGSGDPGYGDPGTNLIPRETFEISSELAIITDFEGSDLAFVTNKALMEKLDGVIKQLLANGKGMTTLHQLAVTKGVKIKWKLGNPANPNATAVYKAEPSDLAGKGSIIIKDENQIVVDIIAEEFIHAVQDAFYDTPTSNDWRNSTNSANMEVEAKLIIDIINVNAFEDIFTGTVKRVIEERQMLNNKDVDLQDKYKYTNQAELEALLNNPSVTAKEKELVQFIINHENFLKETRKSPNQFQA